MSRMRTFAIYVLWLVLFFVFSEIMINLSIETTYQNIGRKDNIELINIYQAQATKVNGRIKGTIFNKDNEIKNKYLKIDFYSDRDNILGTKYIEIENLRENETRQLEIYFKLQDVEYYNISFADEKVEEEISLLPKDMDKKDIMIGTFLAILIYW